MHCLLEGLAHAHFRQFLGLTADSAHRKADPTPAFDHLFLDVNLNKPQDFSEKDVRVVKSIHALLTEAVPNLEGNDAQLIEDHISKLERRLLSKKAGCLRFVSAGLGIGPDVAHPGKKVYKAHWVRSLIAWVSSSWFWCSHTSFKPPFAVSNGIFHSWAVKITHCYPGSHATHC